MSNIARDVIHAPFSLTRRETPKLHMQLTYHQIGEAEVKAATQAGTLDEASVQLLILCGHLNHIFWSETRCIWFILAYESLGSCQGLSVLGI